MIANILLQNNLKNINFKYNVIKLNIRTFVIIFNHIIIIKMKSGKEFNKNNRDKSFYMFVSENDNYNDGENIDINFDRFTCTPGIYFFETSQAFYNKIHKYIRKVTIPDDALVNENHIWGFKTSKIILSPKEIFGDDLELLTTFLSEKSHEVKYTGVCHKLYHSLTQNNQKLNKIDLVNFLLKYDQNLEVLIDNVSDPEITEKLKENIRLIKFFKNANNKHYAFVFSVDGLMLKNYAEKITEIRTSATPIEFFSKDVRNEILKELEELELIAIKQNFKAIEYVENPTDEQCKMAFLQSPSAIDFIKTKLSTDVAIYALSLYPNLILNSAFSSIITQENAIKFVNFFKYIPSEFQTEEICKLALIENISNCKYLNDEFTYLVKFAKKK